MTGLIMANALHQRIAGGLDELALHVRRPWSDYVAKSSVLTFALLRSSELPKSWRLGTWDRWALKDVNADGSLWESGDVVVPRAAATAASTAWLASQLLSVASLVWRSRVGRSYCRSDDRSG
jgi:hypothetical protein